MAQTDDEDVPSSDDETTEETPADESVGVTVTREGACECTIHIEADADGLQKRYDESLGALQKEAALPGFRAGKAPLPLVAKRLASRIRVNVLSAVLEEGYEKGAKDEDLTVVAQLDAPEVEDMEWEPGQPVEFTIKCEVLPKLELSEEQYKGRRIEAPKLEVTDELLGREMQAFARQLGRWDKVEDGAAEAEDYVKAQVTVPGEGEEPVWQGEVDFVPRQSRLGPFTVEGLAEAVAGKNVGESIELEGTVAEGKAGDGVDEALAPLAGQTVKLVAEVIEVMRLVAPEINDELAKKLGLEDADAVRDFVRERLQKRLEDEGKSFKEAALMRAMQETVVFDMPPSVVQRATQDEQRRLLSRAITNGMNVIQARELVEKNAELSQEVAVRKLKGSYLLRKIADLERIYILDDEVKELVRSLGAREGWTQAKTERYVEENDLESSLRSELRDKKTIEMLLAATQFEEVDPEEFQSRRDEAPAPDAEKAEQQ